MRALIVTNMYPTAARPALGSFVHDQVRALRRISGVDVDVFSFEPGSALAYGRAARALHSAARGRFDVVHAHYGLTAWPALAARGRVRVLTLHGTDLHHPRSRPITVSALPFYDLVATVSEPLAGRVPGWATRADVAVLPCGVDLDRFRPVPRPSARAALGLDPREPCLLFPSDPRRPEKRHDLAQAVAAGTRLLALGAVAPDEVPLWVNAANAVLVPSDREGFGLGVLEALACDVPVIATPVGIAPEALVGLQGTLCAAFDRDAWRAALAPHLRAPDPRVAGRARARRYSTDLMANRVVEAWHAADTSSCLYKR
jgi:glycosyltransferase involved in cell wall biosynthesis